jgi:hypothetical protein
VSSRRRDDGNESGLTRSSYGNEPYETVQKRREAAVVLDNPELLMMHAQARFDVRLSCVNDIAP